MVQDYLDKSDATNSPDVVDEDNSDTTESDSGSDSDNSEKVVCVCYSQERAYIQKMNKFAEILKLAILYSCIGFIKNFTHSGEPKFANWTNHWTVTVFKISHTDTLSL